MNDSNKDVGLSLLEYIYIIYNIEYLRILNIYFIFQNFRILCEQYNSVSSIITNVNNLLLNNWTHYNVPQSSEPQDIITNQQHTFPNENSSLTEHNNSPKTFLKKKRIKKKKLLHKNTKCPHKSAKHYAKNMCSTCYHSKGRVKRAWKCPHTEAYHYALGLCHICYQENYSRNKKSDEDSSSDLYMK